MLGERTTEPAFGLPALWIDPAQREEALMRGCTVVDPPSVLATHLTELVREIMAELLSYSETQKLIDDLPREQQKLVSDLIPSVISVGGVQRVLQSLLAERVSIRDLPTILEGIHEACTGNAPRRARHCRHRARPPRPPDQRTACRGGGRYPDHHPLRRMGGRVRRKPGRAPPKNANSRWRPANSPISCAAFATCLTLSGLNHPCCSPAPASACRCARSSSACARPPLSFRKPKFRRAPRQNAGIAVSADVMTIARLTRQVLPRCAGLAPGLCLYRARTQRKPEHKESRPWRMSSSSRPRARRSAASTGRSPLSPPMISAPRPCAPPLNVPNSNPARSTKSSSAKCSPPRKARTPARQAARNAGLPDEKTAFGINQLCGSGLRAVALAAQQIRTGESAIVAAGGMESMSMAPHAAYLRSGTKMGNLEFIDTMIRDGLWDALQRLPHGEHRRERRREIPDYPRIAGPFRRRFPEQGLRRPEGRPL